MFVLRDKRRGVLPVRFEARCSSSEAPAIGFIASTGMITEADCSCIANTPDAVATRRGLEKIKTIDDSSMAGAGVAAAKPA